MIRSAISILVLLLLVESAIACSCAWPLNFDEIEQDAAHIFVGQLASKNSFLSLTNNRYKFSVTETYKGTTQEAVVAWSPKWTPSCGIDTEKKKTYIVIAFKSGKRLWVDRCSTWIAEHYEEMTIEFRNHYSPQEDK